MAGRCLLKQATFPQTFCDYAVIGKKPGERRDKLKPSLNEPYQLIPTNYPRRLGVIDKIPVAQRRLDDPDTGKHDFLNDKNVALPIEVMRSW